MTIEEIQDHLAINKFGVDWSYLMTDDRESLWPEVCRRAQLECAKATLEKAYKNGYVKFKLSSNLTFVERSSIHIDRLSITNESNIVLIV